MSYCDDAQQVVRPLGGDRLAVSDPAWPLERGP